MSLDFPVLIWNIIISELSTKEIINLRSVNKDIRQTLGHNDIWKPIVLECWFNSDYNDGYENPLNDLQEVDDYCKYYRERSRIDVIVSKALYQIASTNNLASNKTDAIEICKLGKKAIPILFKTRTEPLINIINKQANSDYQLSMRYYAELILTTIFKSRFMLKLRDMRNYDPNKAELLFLDLAKSDKSFLNLLVLRNQRIEQIIQKVITSPQYHYTKPPAFKVSLIIKAFHEVVIPKYNEDSLFTSDYKLFSENFSILRIYAGEVPGCPILKLAIIQKLANILDIQSRLSESFLVITDDSFNQGYACLSLTSTGSFKIYTFNYLLDRCRRFGSTNPMDLVRLMTLPLTAEDMKEKLLTGFRNSVSIAQRTNKRAGSGSYYALYPYSRVELAQEDKEYMILFDKEVTGNLLCNYSRGVDNSKYFDLLFDKHPLDLFIFPKYLKYFMAEQTRPAMNRMFTLLNCHEVYPTDSNKCQFRIGDIIMRKRDPSLNLTTFGTSILPNDVFSVFIGESVERTVKTVPSLHSSDLDVSRFVKVEQAELIEKPHIVKDLMDSFIDLGLFFDYFDFDETYRFKESSRFKLIISNRNNNES